jgi:hypothetical protein
VERTLTRFSNGNKNPTASRCSLVKTNPAQKRVFARLGFCVFGLKFGEKSAGYPQGWGLFFFIFLFSFYSRVFN